MTSWTYTAPVVASWARARSNGARRFTDPRHRAARECHRLHALAARPRGWPLGGVYEVAVAYRPADGRRRDADRVLSLVLDALIGVAYEDDADRYLAGCAVTRCPPPGDEDARVPPTGSTLVRVTLVADAPAATAARRRRRAA